MGVHGLWQLLHSAGRPVSLESLEGKVLAVDVSIWLHQTMKGMRDKDGNPLPNAHLQGLFSRVCKLLFYRIKPVFVFDGGVPILKKQTMAARRERKAEAERESSEIAQKLLRNLVKSNAVKKALGETAAPKRVPGVRRGRDQESDIFQLAPLPESEEIGLAINAEEWEKDFELQEAWIKESLSSLSSDAQPDSEEFRSLPMEIQHEVLNELKERKKYHSLSKLIQMPEDSDSFSSYQLKKLMQQSKLTNRIEEVRKEMATKTAGDVPLGDDLYGDEVEARRIVSEDSSHYVLIKGLTKRKQEEEAEKFELYNKVKLEKIEEENDEYEYNKKKMLQDEKKQKQLIKVVSAGSDDSDVEIVMKKKYNRKQRKRKSSQKEVYKGSMKRREDLSETETMKTLSSSSFQVAAQSDEMDSSSEDEGFIEVTIDPTAVVEEDELFPASIFQTSSEPLTLPEVIPHKNLKTSDIQQPGDPPSQIRKEPNSTERAQLGSEDVIQKLASDESVVAKRKSVLNDILQQLEEKKKKLNETLQEVEGGDGGDVVPDTSTSGGFFREDSDEVEDEQSCPAFSSGDAGLKSAHEGKAQTRKDSVPLSDSDEELQLAIEISLQTAVNSSHKTNTSPGLTKANKESPASSSVKSNIDNVRLSNNESKTNIQGITEELKSALSETEESLNEKGISSSSDSEVSEEENLDGSKLSISPSKAVARPQPEDFEGEDEIETYFHNLNNDDLMEMNTDLDSERMALLMEQGKQNRLATSVTEQINMEAQELLRLFGIPYLVSPMEAEAQCAFLDITDQTQGTITDDSDIWLFGGRRMYKNFFNQSKHVELFTFDNIHKHFGLGREQLINIALLCGSDYTEGIQGVGPVRALEIMAEFPGDGLEGLCRFKQWWDKIKRQGIQTLENRTRDRLKDLKLFPGFPSKTVVDAYLNPTVDDSTERFTWRLPELDLLRDFAKTKFGWSKEKTDQSLLPMIKQLTKKDSQARISAFFHPDSFTPVSKIKSGRLKKALALVKNSQGKSGDGSVDHEGSDDTSARVNVKSKSHVENPNAGIQDGIKSNVKSKSKSDGGKGRKRKLEADKGLDINDQKLERDKSSIQSASEADSDGFMLAMAEKVKQASAVLKKMKEKNQSCPPMKGSCTAKPRNKTVASLDRAKPKIKGKPRGATAHKRPSVKAVGNLSESSSSDQSDDGSEKTKPTSAGHSNSVDKLKTPPKLARDKPPNNFHSSLSDKTQVKKSQGISKVSFEKTSKIMSDMGSVSTHVVKGQTPQPALNHDDENSLQNKEITPIPLASSNLSSSSTDAVDKSTAEVDIKKADVSIINKQNLPETLAYLNKRSREDKMLLHQLKGEHVKNAVEKRLEESEKRAAAEMLKARPQDKDTDQVMSFEDLLGGMDTLTKAKKLSKTKKQVKDISKHSQKNKSHKVMDKANLDDFSFASLMGEDTFEDVSPPEVSKKLKIQDKSDRNKDSFTVGDQSSKGSKSARAKNFDQPIAGSDDEDDAYRRKLGTKEVFRRQMEHLTDARSVRGHGILPLQSSGNASKGRAFAGKGKGRGKNRNQTGSAQVEDSDDITEYAMMTAEDLGSDFSDCDFT
ncbi:DNA excision repair protein ERCC-5-like [Physella acuta]|uniref:DNA excision repair protein ERCC-5-like n=1 Tax=Physella acuta TaxID=109671 RepID=UPI0027DC2634|nr:DNA excision repair protein ERCC-5-like [Physella acuta]